MTTNKNKEQTEMWFRYLRDQICKSFEEIENKFQHRLIKKKPGKFTRKKWKRRNERGTRDEKLCRPG